MRLKILFVVIVLENVILTKCQDNSTEIKTQENDDEIMRNNQTSSDLSIETRDLKDDVPENLLVPLANVKSQIAKISGSSSSSQKNVV